LRFDGRADCFTATGVERTESGPVRSAVRVESVFGASRLRQTFRLSRGSGLLEVEVRVDWRESRRTLKLRWPLLLEAPRATYEVPYGFVERPAGGDEEPGQAWVDCSGRHPSTGLAHGVSLLNDGKYSFDVDGAELGLTVLRSPAYAHHDPHRPKSWDGLEYLDQGEQEFTYALLPHAEPWLAATVRRAAELNQRPLVLLDTWHQGALPHIASLAEAQPENVVVSVIKGAEDDPSACVLRCYETAGIASEATISLPAFGREIRTRLAPGEIKTFLLPEDPDQPVEETDLLEWR
jgi:alpha-mannosidase